MRLARSAPSAPLVGVLLAALFVSGCDDMRLGRPDALWLLWLLPALVVFQVWSARRRALLLRRFATPALLDRIVLGASPARRGLKAVLLVVGLAACLLALAGFAYGFSWEEVQRRGVDVAIALDVSESMLVEDADPGSGLSRLERARREIADLVDVMQGDRLALVAFAGMAFVELPLTLDYEAARLFLDVLSPDLIPVQGTALDEAIDQIVDVAPRGDIDAARRLVEDEDVSIAGEPLGEHDLLLVAAAQPAGDPIRTRRFDAQLVDHALRFAAFAPRIQESPPRHAPVIR